MHRWIDHTAELELRLEADSERALLAEALEALGELLAEHAHSTEGPAEAHEIHASAPDRPALLAEWLSELVFLVETQGLLPQRVERLELRGEQLEASVSGRRCSPPHLVKAVTYHRLEMTERDGVWEGTVILDV